MDLFEYMRQEQQQTESPLAARIRPATLDEVVGQEHIIGKGRLLRRAIQADKLGSLIFYGPPGTGKTTLAKVIANTTSAEFVQLNATTSGKKDMEMAVRAAQDRMGMYGKKTILFIDEIHRFNKSQQDYLLPFVEDGTVTLIGATTENPYFEVNGALISRSTVFELKPLSEQDIRALILRAVYDSEKGMGMYNAVIDDDAAAFLADVAGGDARRALSAVELGVLTTEPSGDGKIHLTLEIAQECIQRRAPRYDKGGDNHYDVISAFIKSMRGSDPDAAVYYLARMLEAGEDPKFIARRIMICASEDVGNADPQAIQVAVSCSLACERIGMPESKIILSQAAAYVACAPKSNAAVEAIGAAGELVKKTGNLPVPAYLRDSHYGGASKLGRGIGYQYAHLYEEHYSGQPYLPESVRGVRLYEPSENGYEKEIRERLYRLTGDSRYTAPEELLARGTET
ncbi:MAG: replication-associated recombination protein A [Eubacteriales bacterium]|nr:replication-associated recombination protein A [Eubacteriales bacterium]